MARINISPYTQQVDEFGRPVDPQFYMPPPANQDNPFAPVVVPPDLPTPAEQQLAKLKPPSYEDYKPGRFRTVLNAIAGGLAGAAGGPKTGYDIGHRLSYGDFNAAQASYEAEADRLKTAIGMEKSQRERAYKPVEYGIKRGIAQVGAEDKEVKRDQAQQNIDIKAAGEASKAEHRKQLEIIARDKLDRQKLDPFTLLQQTDDPDERDAILKVYKDMKSATQKTPEQIADEARARTTGTLEAQDTPLGQRVAGNLAGARTGASAMANFQAQATPLAAEAVGNLTRAREEAKLDVQDSEQAARVAQGKEASKLTANMRDTASSAQKALVHIPRIRKQIQELGPELTTLMPRWQEFMAGKIGNNPRFATLRTNIGLLQTLAAKVHVGARGSVAITKKFEELMNAKTMNADTLRAAIDEVEVWMKEYSKLKAPGVTVEDNKPKFKLQFEEDKD